MKPPAEGPDVSELLKRIETLEEEVLPPWTRELDDFACQLADANAQAAKPHVCELHANYRSATASAAAL